MGDQSNEILTIAGKQVRVAHSGKFTDCCGKCCLWAECQTLPKKATGYCHGERLDAYFVPAKEIEGTSPKVTPIPSNEDEDEAAEMAAYKHYPNSPSTGQFGTGDYQPEEDNSLDREVFVKGFKDGILYERERMMKEAVEAEVYWNRGNEPSVIVHLPKGSAMPGDKVKLIILK